jgi:phenylalanyl-tRNA synthetase beta chain
MKISYNWLNSYLPEEIEIEKLGKILTSIGLEVESIEPTSSHANGLAGIVIGKVLTCEQHPNADKLKVTTVDIGQEAPLQIVCGASNVAAGQVVVVAPLGATIYPTNGEPTTMKAMKLRSIESHGMICAEDELGLGTSHDGIMVLSDDTKAGSAAADYFKVENDYVIEIGITANRIDAMSHLGVARDVSAWLTHNNKFASRIKSPKQENNFDAKIAPCKVNIKIEDEMACQRYAGVILENLTVAPSPTWLQNRLKAIGVRPINNIVDITNFVLHETGQPLHAFNMSTIEGDEINVTLAKGGEKFITLDDKERTLRTGDILINNAKETMCIGGVFGGIKSGVNENTTAIFLEAAWFNPINIRQTSVHHGLRTDAAIRFEKQIDISNVPTALKRAIYLIKELCPNAAYSQIEDVYPTPHVKKEIGLKYRYLTKVSGKQYHAETIKSIMQALGFEVSKDGIDEMHFLVPLHKTDINIPVDLVEEIMRIDGLDNIEIPNTLQISLGASPLLEQENIKEKIANTLTGMGANELITNSIVDSKLYTEVQNSLGVKMMNNLSADLDTLRLNMQESILQVISHNINRKQQDLFFYDFGVVYMVNKEGQFIETPTLCIAITGLETFANWQEKSKLANIYSLKGIITKAINTLGLQVQFKETEAGLSVEINGKKAGSVLDIAKNNLKKHDIKQAVFIAEVNWNVVLEQCKKTVVKYKELSKYPSVERDLSLVVGSQTKYAALESAIKKANVPQLTTFNLFDVFENEKLGANKKSMAINFTFNSELQTFTDKDIDKMMQKITTTLEKEVLAEIRK